MADETSQLHTKIGKVFVRKQLHDKYGGQRFGGIATPSSFPFVFLFTKMKEGFSRGGFGRMGNEGKTFSYNDEWIVEEVEDKKVPIFIFSGEGLKGNMKLKSGNLAIFSHKTLGKTLILFNNIGNGQAQLIASLKYESHFFKKERDIDGEFRQQLYFALSPTPITQSNPRFWTLINLDQGHFNTLPSQHILSSHLASFERRFEIQEQEPGRTFLSRESTKTVLKKEEEESPLVIDLSAPTRDWTGSYQVKKETTYPYISPTKHQSIAHELVKKKEPPSSMQTAHLTLKRKPFQEDREQQRKKLLLQVKKQPSTSVDLDDLLSAQSSYLSQLKT